MSLQQRQMCEGCGLKHPNYGLPAQRADAVVHLLRGGGGEGGDARR